MLFGTCSGGRTKEQHGNSKPFAKINLHRKSKEVIATVHIKMALHCINASTVSARLLYTLELQVHPPGKRHLTVRADSLLDHTIRTRLE